MSRLEFGFEWIDPGAARGAELRATWARLRIQVGDQVVTRVEDRDVHSVREEVYLPLYPIAEWVATNWWALLNEVASDSRLVGGYLRRHSLGAASEGFAAPPLLIEPTGEQFLLKWKHTDLPEYGVSFISDGTAYLERQQVQEALARFVDAVVARLEHEGVADSLLQEEWKAVKNSPHSENEFLLIAGRLGCDPFSLDQSEQDILIKASSSLSQSIANEFFATVDLTTLDSQASALHDVIANARTIELHMQPLIKLRDRGLEVKAGIAPWQQGYSAAREARRALHLNGEVVGSVERIGEFLGINRAEWEKAARGTISGVPAVDAVVALTRNGAPCFAVRPSRPTGRAFAICRALFEYLTWPTESAAVVVNTHSERQKRNRAFAAEFLAPAEKLREIIGDRAVSDEEIQEIADKLDVAPYVVRHQIENHNLAPIESWSEHPF